MRRIRLEAASLIGAPATCSTGATAAPSCMSGLLMPSGPTIGATPPSTPTATTRSDMPAAHANV